MYIIGLTYLYGRLQMFHIACVPRLSRNGPCLPLFHNMNQDGTVCCMYVKC